MKFKEFVGKLNDFLMKNHKQYSDFISTVSTFCGVSKRSAEGWLDGVYFPKGITLLKFREIFSNSVLYDFEDMKVLSKELRLFAKLIAHGKVTVEDTCKEIGFSSKDELLRPLTGFRFPGKERMEKIHVFVAERSAQLNEASIFVFHHFSIFDETFKEAMGDTKGTAPVAVRNKAVKGGDLIKSLGGIQLLISATKNDIEALLNGSPEDRQQFRDIIGTNNLFDISNNIHEFYEAIVPFSSETAFRRRAEK